MAAIDDAIRVHQSLAKLQDAKLSAAAAQFAGGVAALHQTFQNGTKVLDLLTGKTGVVIGGRRANVIVPATRQQSS